MTFVPAPTPVSIVSPWSLPKVARSRSSTLRSPTDWPPVSPREHVREVPGINTDAVILDRDDSLVAAVFRGNLQPGGSGEPLKAVPDGVFHQWLQHERRHPHGKHLRGYSQADREAVAETCAL